MFFLMRMTFWLGLVLALLPTDKTPDSEKLPQVGASEAVSAVTAAVFDMAQFCTRQPAACNIGGQAAVVITHRAQAGARKVYQSITDKKPPNTMEAKRLPDHTGSIARDDGDDDMPRMQDTLTPDDLQMEWQPASFGK